MSSKSTGQKRCAVQSELQPHCLSKTFVSLQSFNTFVCGGDSFMFEHMSQGSVASERRAWKFAVLM